MWRRANPEKAKLQNYRQDRKRREFLDNLKSGPCLDCGRTYAPECMDFDHVRGEKKFNVGSKYRRTVPDMLSEIAKCELVCSNCHRTRTKNRRLN